MFYCQNINALSDITLYFVGYVLSYCTASQAEGRGFDPHLPLKFTVSYSKCS